MLVLLLAGIFSSTGCLVIGGKTQVCGNTKQAEERTQQAEIRIAQLEDRIKTLEHYAGISTPQSKETTISVASITSEKPVVPPPAPIEPRQLIQQPNVFAGGSISNSASF